MKNSSLFLFWAGLYALCALFGLTPLQGSFGSVMMTILSLLFFIPGGILVYRGIWHQDRKLLRTVRILSLCSLILTLVFLTASFLTVLSSDAVGLTIHILLTLFSVPMICSGYWILSIFLWACLFISSFLKKKKV